MNTLRISWIKNSLGRLSYNKYVDKKLLEFIMVTLVFITAFTVYELKQFSTPLLYGIDGPYYYIQVSSIINNGHLKYPDPPLAFYILTGFSVLLNDIFVGIKVGSIIVTLLALYAIYYLVKKITNPIGGLTACLIYAFSPALIRLSLDLMKNAMGLTFLSFTLLFSYLALKKQNLRFSILSSVFAILTGLIHILDFTVIYAILLLLTIMNIRNKHALKYVILPTVFGSILLALGFIFYDIMGGDPYRIIFFIYDLLGDRQLLMFNMYVLPNVILPLSIGIVGLLLCTRLRNYVDKTLLFILSLTIIALNLPFYPSQHLWRFNLMIAILAPLILGVAVGYVKGTISRLVFTLVLLGFLIPQFTAQIYLIRPSISLGEYQEIKQLISIVPNNTIFVVPNTKLRYWVETLTSNVVKSPREAPAYSYIVIVQEKVPFKFKKPVPLMAKPFYNGVYIEAYILPPKRLKP